MSYLFDHFFSLICGLTLGAVYALVALGYTLVYGVLRLINFAHSEVFMYGTFAALWAVIAAGWPVRRGCRVGVLCVLAMLAAAMVMSGVIAVALERVAYRPLRKRNAPPLIALISAIGASFVLAERWACGTSSAKFVGLDVELDNYVGRARDTPLPADHRAQAGVHIGDYAR